MISWKAGILLLGFLFFAPILASGKTWIVDDDEGPGVDFTDIQPAIDAAWLGDIIVVRNGDYNGFTLVKDLILIADTGHRPNVEGDITVSGIDTTAVISGFDAVRLDITQSTGTVLVDDCAFIDTSYYPDSPMAEIEYCALVMFSRCHVQDKNEGYPGNTGVCVTESTVILSECAIFGQDGSEGQLSDPPYEGGSALAAEKSALHIQATSCEGGLGGDYWGDDYFACDGGHGIEISESTLHLFGLANHVVKGGKGGTCNTWPYFADPGDGIRPLWSTIAYSGIDLSNINPIEDETCEIIEVQPDLPVITLEGTGQFGDYIEVMLHGLQGSTYALFLSTLPDAFPLRVLYTHLLLDPLSLLFLAGGKLPASHLFHIPSQATDYRGVPVIFQAYVSRPVGPSYISTSAGFVLR